MKKDTQIFVLCANLRLLCGSQWSFSCDASGKFIAQTTAESQVQTFSLVAKLSAPTFNIAPSQPFAIKNAFTHLVLIKSCAVSGNKVSICDEENFVTSPRRKVVCLNDKNNTITPIISTVKTLSFAERCTKKGVIAMQLRRFCSENCAI